MKIRFPCPGLVCILVCGALSQSQTTGPSVLRDSTAKTGIVSEKYADAMKSLPPGVAEKIAAAREAAKAAKADLDAMKSVGKTPEEVEKMILEKKAAALKNLQKALDALDGLPNDIKKHATESKDVVSKRLDERKVEAKNSQSGTEK